MAEYYNSLTFEDYPPKELLGSSIYADSIKRLSFQYRTKNEDKLIAYIALSQDSPDMKLSNVDTQQKGCRILSLYVEPYQTEHYQVADVILLEALLDEAEYYIYGWVDNRNGEFQFDYLWFNVNDFNSQEVIERIDGLIINGEVAYKTIDRNNESN